MDTLRRVRKLLEKAAFGDTLLPQEFTIGLRDPQTEVAVWLLGAGEPLDVTFRCTTACAAPLTLCVSSDEGQLPEDFAHREMRLVFCERGGTGRVLGELQLHPMEAITHTGMQLLLCRISGSSNHCLPPFRLWMHAKMRAYEQRKGVKSFDVKMGFADFRASLVTFIRPHPLALVSLHTEAGGNLFPMNLMGDLGHGYFGFGLKGSRRAAHLVAHSRRIALCSVPLDQCHVGFRLAINHTKNAIEWSELPFDLRHSQTFEIPYPAFAPRVREMEIESVKSLGSHTFFVARTVTDTRYADVPCVHMIHGHYAWWRSRGSREALRASVAEDRLRKQGPIPAP